MSKVHISPDGIVRPCRARAGACRYGSSDHFNSYDEARKHAYNKMNVTYGVIPKDRERLPSKVMRLFKDERFGEWERTGSVYHKSLTEVDEIDWVHVEDEDATRHGLARMARRKDFEDNFAYYDEETGEQLISGIGEPYKAYLVKSNDNRYPKSHPRHKRVTRMNVYTSGYTEIIDKDLPKIITQYSMSPERHEAHTIMSGYAPSDDEKAFYRITEKAHKFSNRNLASK